MSDPVSDPPRAVVAIDEEGRIVELDLGAEELFGLDRSQALGRPIAELIIPGRRASEQPSGGRFRRRSEFPAPRGEDAEARVELVVRRTDEGTARFVASIRDLSRRGGADFDSALQALLESAEEVAAIGSWDWNLDTDELLWSDNLFRLHGLEPGEVAPTPRLVVEQAHPDDRDRIERECDTARRDGQLGPLEYRCVLPDGAVRHLRAKQAVTEREEGGPRRIVGSVQDVTERQRAERRIAAHIAVSEALVEWRSLEQGATGLLRNLAEALDCVAGVLWLPEGDVLVARVIWRSAATEVFELESVIRQLRLPRGIGLAGQAWEAAKPIDVASLDEDPRFGSFGEAGRRGAVALPAVHGQEVLCVLELYLSEPMSSDASDRFLRSMTGIGYELGEFLAHRRGQLKAHGLTPRELEVLQLAAEGCSGREIAERLVVSPATVRTHFDHIYEKYGVSGRAAAVAKALRDGLIH